jgi:transcriptional regulator with XRE-family HTH domain
MKLDAYLHAHGLTSAEFGELAGLGSKQVVHKYRHGLRFPNPEALRRIREATNGAVTADDFVDQHAGASPPYRAREDAPPPRAKRSTPKRDSNTPSSRERAA